MSERTVDQKDYNKIESFFDEMAVSQVYNKIVTNNLMNHQELYGELHKLIKENYQDQAFSMIDLGCGDASQTAKALKGLSLAKFTGLDLSQKALEDVKKSFSDFDCEINLIQGNYTNDLNKIDEQFDIILSGFSVHHLSIPEKKEFFKSCKKLLKAGGKLIVLDIIKEKGESREEYLEKWDKYQASWTALNKEESAYTNNHIHTADFPESFYDYEQMSQEAGFNKANKSIQIKMYAFMLFE